jgi:hypothetical protein
MGLWLAVEKSIHELIGSLTIKKPNIKESLERDRK